MELVASGAYKTGSMLPPERELAGALGISRSTLRETIAALETLGVVIVRANHGIEIAPEAASIELPWRRTRAHRSPQEQFAALRMIAIEVAGLAAEAEDKSGLRRLKRTLHALKPEMDDAWSAHLADFHYELAQLAGNRVFSGWVRELWAATESPSWRPYAPGPRTREDRERERWLHQRLLAAVADGRAPVARQRMGACFRWREVLWFGQERSP